MYKRTISEMTTKTSRSALPENRSLIVDVIVELHYYFVLSSNIFCFFRVVFATPPLHCTTSPNPAS